jgi:hypothetical protein
LSKEKAMAALSPHWEYLSEPARSRQLGDDGHYKRPPQTLSSVTDNYLFFKRIKPEQTRRSDLT